MNLLQTQSNLKYIGVYIYHSHILKNQASY